jgi:hypothetical protein
VDPTRQLVRFQVRLMVTTRGGLHKRRVAYLVVQLA